MLSLPLSICVALDVTTYDGNNSAYVIRTVLNHVSKPGGGGTSL